MKALRLFASGLLLVGCTPGITGFEGTPGARHEAVRVSVEVNERGEMLDAISVHFTAEEVPPAPTGGEMIGSVVVEDAAGRALATVDVPRPAPVSIVDTDGGGDVAFPDTTSVVVPWPPEADHVRVGSTVYPPAPPPGPVLPPGAPAPPPSEPGTDGGAVPGVVAVHQSGPSNQRFDFVVVGDNYGSAGHAKFVSDVQRFATALLATEPYRTFTDRINVWAVPTAAGSLSCHHGCQGIERLICCDQGAALATAHSAVAEAESVLVLVDSATYGGSGGEIAVGYSGPHMETVMLHELGHTLNLRDEYTYEGGDASVYSASESGVNCSLVDPPHWDHWMDEPGVGAFAGCRFANAFRPTDAGCLMHRAGHPEYCPVCREHVALRIYAALGPLITAATPEPPADAPISIGDMAARFELETQAVGEPTFAWNLDHEAAGGDADMLEVTACSVTGPTLLSATVNDRLSFVRRDPARVMTDTVTWELEPDPDASTGACLPMCLGDGCTLGTACCDAGVACYPTSAEATEGSCCAIADFRCGGDGDCCGDMACIDGSCQCRAVGESCISHRECCGGAFCDAGVCTL